MLDFISITEIYINYRYCDKETLNSNVIHGLHNYVYVHGIH